MKVHFAGILCSEKVFETGIVKYVLESYHYLRNNSKASKIIQIMNRSNHAIMDSGLFTMMFGSEANVKRSESDLIKMLDGYCDFINKSGYIHSVVEYDVQKIFSPELAWDLRLYMKSKVKNTIINVYHLEDKNPDKLIEYADYIAVSIPELRKHASRKELVAVGDYILKKALRKGIRVHMLGCTEKELLIRWKDAFSCDSTSWIVGRFNNFKIQSEEKKQIDVNAIYEKYKNEQIADFSKSDYLNYYSVRNCILNYEKWAGSQA